MKAIVIEHAGGPEVLQVGDWPRPEARPGWVLVHIKAFGLNRSELLTRLGQSPECHLSPHSRHRVRWHG